MLTALVSLLTIVLPRHCTLYIHAGSGNVDGRFIQETGYDSAYIVLDDKVLDHLGCYINLAADGIKYHPGQGMSMCQLLYVHGI